jgi:hypothetical protein
MKDAQNEDQTQNIGIKPTLYFYARHRFTSKGKARNEYL